MAVWFLAATSSFFFFFLLVSVVFFCSSRPDSDSGREEQKYQRVHSWGVFLKKNSYCHESMVS
jgi:hypothetical protein